MTVTCKVYNVRPCTALYYPSPSVPYTPNMTFPQGVRWADQHSEKKPQTVFDPLTCPNLDAFLDAVTNERQRTGAVEWSTEGKCRQYLVIMWYANVVNKQEYSGLGLFSKRPFFVRSRPIFPFFDTWKSR